MYLKCQFISLLLSFSSIVGKIIFLPDDKIEECSKPGESAGYYDYTDVEIIIETDRDIYLNGTFTFLKEVTAPWKTHVFTEQYIRSQWVPAVIEKKIPDLCKALRDPTELTYHHLKDQIGCPIPAGGEWKFDMMRITNIPMVLLPNMMGKWRLTSKNYFSDSDKTECTRFYVDIIEVK